MVTSPPALREALSKVLNDHEVPSRGPALEGGLPSCPPPSGYPLSLLDGELPEEGSSVPFYVVNSAPSKGLETVRKPLADVFMLETVGVARPIIGPGGGTTALWLLVPRSCPSLGFLGEKPAQTYLHPTARPGPVTSL